MYEIVRISKIKEDQNGTELLISIPGKYIKDMVLDKHIRHAEMRFDDGRYISIYQRKKPMQHFLTSLNGTEMRRKM